MNRFSGFSGFGKTGQINNLHTIAPDGVLATGGTPALGERFAVDSPLLEVQQVGFASDIAADYNPHLNWRRSHPASASVLHPA